MKSLIKSTASALLLAPLCLLAPVQAAAKESAHIVQTAKAVPTVPAAQNAPKPALWTLKDEDSTIYLFGTVHMLPRDQNWLTAPVKAAIESADTLVFEIIPPDNQQAAMGLIGQYGLLPADKKLSEMLPQEDQAKFQETLTTFSVPAAHADRMKPWFAATMLAVMPLQAAGFDADQGVEMQLKSLYGNSGKKLEALETMEQQFQIFDGIPQQDQLRYLSETIHQIDDAVPIVSEMISQWLSGDADALAKVMNESLSATPELADALLYDRNEAWASQLQDMLKQPGTIFVAVGAGHLAGEQSVQDFLQDRGLKVERVVY